MQLHSTDVESPPPPPRACMRIHPDNKSCSDLGRALVLNGPPAKPPGGLLRTSIRPTLNLILLRASVCTFTLRVSHAPISVECWF